jgi:hypothetical protein
MQPVLDVAYETVGGNEEQQGNPYKPITLPEPQKLIQENPGGSLCLELSDLVFPEAGQELTGHDRMGAHIRLPPSYEFGYGIELPQVRAAAAVVTHHIRRSATRRRASAGSG